MAKSLPPVLFLYLLAFSCFSLLALGSRESREEVRRESREGRQEQGNECQIDRINALEPSSRVKSEAGVSEFWDPSEDQFRCAGVAFLRRTIEPKGLLLPYFRSAPELYYVIKGKGIRGLSIPGCPETYQSVSRGESEGRSGTRDQHQKIWRIRQGDIFAVPAGVVNWVFNDAEEELVVVTLVDTANEINQLDQSSPRTFFLAGNPEQEFEEERSQRGEEDTKNIFSGFGSKILGEIFRLPRETIDRLQSNQDDTRGQIVKAEQLRVIRPPSEREDEQWESRREHRGNNVALPACTASLIENVDDPSKADIFVPQAGRLTTLNSLNLPILRFLRLSAEKGVLYKNALMAPHWTLNAHNLIYATRGSARVQIVNERGQDIFRGVLRENQLVVVPQNFALVKQAGDEGFEWVSFKTNDNALIQTVAGSTSFIKALPIEVVMNSYRVSREEAEKLKNEREETLLFAGSSRSERRGDKSERRGDESERRGDKSERRGDESERRGEKSERRGDESERERRDVE